MSLLIFFIPSEPLLVKLLFKLIPMWLIILFAYRQFRPMPLKFTIFCYRDCCRYPLFERLDYDHLLRGPIPDCQKHLGFDSPRVQALGSSSLNTTAAP